MKELLLLQHVVLRRYSTMKIPGKGSVNLWGQDVGEIIYYSAADYRKSAWFLQSVPCVRLLNDFSSASVVSVAVWARGDVPLRRPRLKPDQTGIVIQNALSTLTSNMTSRCLRTQQLKLWLIKTTTEPPMTCCTFCVDRSDRHRSAPQLSAVSVYSGACSVRCSSSRSENVISCLHSSCDYKKSQRMNKQNQTMSRVLCVAGGKAFPQEFYCEAPDCAARVKSVFCNDKQLLSGDRIQECAGPPPPDSVCQHQGRAFVSTVSGATCEFEGTDSYIKTKKCTGIYLYSQESFVIIIWCSSLCH